MKKLNFTFLLAVLLSMVGARALAHDIEVKNGDGKTIYYKYQWANNKTELSVSYRGSSNSDYSNVYSGNVVIPKSVTYNGKTYSVTSIGYDAFYNCSGLTNVTIPNSVNTIEGYAFRNCSGLTSITIPNSVTSIGYGAFSGCSGLTSVTIPNSVTDIGDLAFYYCSGLTSVTIPNSVTKIGFSAFNNCSGLKSVTIPNSVTSIGIDAFEFCSGLTSVTIPNSVTDIGDCAFGYCSGLKSVTIPKSVTSIEGNAFSYCYNLTSIVVETGNTKYDSRNNCNAIIEKASNTLKTGCKNTIIPSSVTSISYRAFSGCTGLTSVTIPNSVTSIGSYAFSGCSGLTSVTIPNSVTTIENGIFYKCSGLTSITIPKFVTSIGESAFYQCYGLTSVTIPNSVTSIGRYAFSGCSGLTSVTIPNSVTSIGNDAFAFCSGLTSVTIPNSVTSIGSYAFNGCSGLTSVTIGNSVTNIAEDAFAGCTILNTITCYATTPPTLLDNGFSDSFAYDKIGSTCKVFVPKGRVNAYKAATGWKRFSNIYEIGTAVDEGFDLQAKLDAIAAKGTSTASKPETIEIPAEGITIDTHIYVRNGCHAKLTGGPVRISSQIPGEFPIHIQKSNSLTFESITIDLANNDFNYNQGIFLVFGELKINKVYFINVPQRMGKYGKCLFGVIGGTLNISYTTIKTVEISIVSGYNEKGEIWLVDSELETLNPVVDDGTFSTVWIAGGKMKGGGNNYVISAADVDISHDAIIEAVSHARLCDYVVTRTGKFWNFTCKGGDCIVIQQSAVITGSFAMPAIRLFKDAVITATSKLQYKWLVYSSDWKNFTLEKAFIKGDGYYKLTAADFNQMTFQGLPNDLEAYYDAKDYSVKLRKKTVVEEKVDNSDDLQNFIDGLGDNKGTEDDPIKVPVGDDGLVIDKDVDIEDDLQLLIDGTGRDDLQILIDGGYINQKVGLGYFGFKNLWMGSSAGTRASASGGGINNRGKMVFSNCTLADGTYSINNLAGGTLILKENTVAGSSDGLIVNSGNVYLDGTVSVGNLENKTGGRIYITEALTENINIRFTSENDIEYNTPIIMGEESYSEMYYNYYTLTENDLSHINISLPEGYAWKYSEDMGGVVVYATSGISGLDADCPSVVGTYDTTGRKVTETRRGVHIQRMSNGEVRKVVMK